MPELKEQSMVADKYISFLKWCLSTNQAVPKSISEINWQELLAFARKQSITGTYASVILGDNQALSGCDWYGNRPSEDDVMDWMGEAIKLRRRNTTLFAKSAEVSEQLRRKGFENCILKGQGLALLYPDPYLRTAGDIDIYLKGGRKRVTAFVDRVCPGQTLRYHHIDFPVYPEVPIEVHFTPSYMYNPIHNHRIQQWFENVMPKQCAHHVGLPDGKGEIPVPTTAFNTVYILSHLYRHVFSEGFGLRQLLDYYYVLSQDISKEEAFEARQLIKSMGMGKFAGGVMYLLQQCFGLPDERLLFPVNKKDGEFLLNEVLIGGNFGKYDKRLGDIQHEDKLQRNIRMTRRSLRFTLHYPSEALCEPLFRFQFAMWKKMKGRK